ncbi:MAG: thioredoxin fold domain-containing protein [Desulfobacula sp.]|nr:thioredoxin fold domain-containing protein [Desulfobacula sp.]
MAVKLGYTNIYRDPLGYPEWHARGFPVKSTPTDAVDIDQKGQIPDTFKNDAYGPLHGWAMLWTLLGIFVGGMALNLTPCVYPLIPITISYFGGRSGKGQTIAHGVCYVSGIAFTNSMLGVFAALTGGLMGALLQHPLVLMIIAALLISLSFSLFGFWELRVPYGLMQVATKSHAGYSGSLFMGLMMGIVAAPCIGPFVLGLLTWVASMGSPWLGFIIFFTLSLGLGLPFFFLALFSGSISKLPKSGEWMLWVRKLMGWVLMGMAVYFIQPLLSKTIGTFAMAGVALFAGLHLGWIDKTKAGFKSFEWIKLTAAMFALVYTILLVETFITKGAGASFNSYDKNLLAQAKNEEKLVIIDFSAEWCSPCRELDDITFHDDKVVDQIKKNFLLLKVDLTRKGDPAYEKLLKEYRVKGVPTIVFLDRKGQEIKKFRLVDFEPPKQFLERLNKVKQIQEK